MQITKKEFQENLAGYSIVDCCVRQAGIVYFLAQNDAEAIEASVISQHTVQKRVIPFVTVEGGGDRWSHTQLTGFETMCCGAARFPKAQFVGVDGGGQVYVLGSGESDIQAKIPKALEGPRRGGITRLRMIDGWLFVAGGYYSVGRRLGKDQWEGLCYDLPEPKRSDAGNVDRTDNMRFQDIDGFSTEELYAVAGKGRVWRLKNKSWQRMAFPSNMYLHAVCCGGDGTVYIGAQSGAIFAGRDEQWEMIHGNTMSLPFQDMVWHADRLWCTSSYGIWVLEDGQLQPADVSPEIRVCAGHLSVGDGVMLMAGTHGAALHDGTGWKLLFNRLEMEQGEGS